MTRAVAALALAVAVAAPVAAHADEMCYYRDRFAEACRDPEYRACLLYGEVVRQDFEVGNGCPNWG